jgi:hypothetical protein
LQPMIRNLLKMQLPLQLEEAYREKILTEGKQVITYNKNAGRTANIEVEPLILRGTPEEEIIGFAE